MTGMVPPEEEIVTRSQCMRQNRPPRSAFRVQCGQSCPVEFDRSNPAHSGMARDSSAQTKTSAVKLNSISSGKPEVKAQGRGVTCELTAAGRSPHRRVV